MKEMAILHSKVKDFAIKTSFEGKEKKFEWNGKNNFTCSLPTRWMEKNHAGKEVVLYDNYAQVLLNKFPNELELVKVKQEAAVVQPAITGVSSGVEASAEPKEEAPEKPKRKYIKREVKE